MKHESITTKCKMFLETTEPFTESMCILKESSVLGIMSYHKNLNKTSYLVTELLCLNCYRKTGTLLHYQKAVKQNIIYEKRKNKRWRIRMLWPLRKLNCMTMTQMRNWSSSSRSSQTIIQTDKNNNSNEIIIWLTF